MLRVALVFALVLAGCAGPATGDRISWSVTDVDGRAHSDTTVAGKPTVLFFMATWCTSCRSLAPGLADLADANPEVQFLSVGWDPSEDAADLRGWATQYRNDWPHALDPGAKTAQAFSITSQSSVVLLDDTAAVAQAWGYGQANKEKIASAIAGL